MPKTVDFTHELFVDVLKYTLDYMQTGETVCGAEDPAVLTVTDELAAKHPELAGYSVVRVTERYVNAWKSDTFLEFSNLEITAEERERYEELWTE
jgi:hypothetical protein